MQQSLFLIKSWLLHNYFHISGDDLAVGIGHLLLRRKEDYVYMKRQRRRNESSEIQNWTAVSFVVAAEDGCDVRRQGRRCYSSATREV